MPLFRKKSTPACPRSRLRGAARHSKYPRSTSGAVIASCRRFQLERAKPYSASAAFWGAERLFWQSPGCMRLQWAMPAALLRTRLRGGLHGRDWYAEVVRVIYDRRDRYADLLKTFWESHDPDPGDAPGKRCGYAVSVAIYVLDKDSGEVAEESNRLYQARLTAAEAGTITTETATCLSSSMRGIITSNTWRRIRMVLRVMRL